METARGTWRGVRRKTNFFIVNDVPEPQKSRLSWHLECLVNCVVCCCKAVSILAAHLPQPFLRGAFASTVFSLTVVGFPQMKMTMKLILNSINTILPRTL